MQVPIALQQKQESLNKIRLSLNKSFLKNRNKATKVQKIIIAAEGLSVVNFWNRRLSGGGKKKKEYHIIPLYSSTQVSTLILVAFHK